MVVEKTKLTKWLAIIKKYVNTRELRYSEFPICWVRNARDKEWNER